MAPDARTEPVARRAGAGWRRTTLFTGAGLLTTAGIASVDYATGPELPLSLVYAPVVVAVSWWSGLVAGSVIAVASVVGLLIANVSFDPGPQILYEVFGRLAIFASAAFLVDLARRQRDTLAAQGADLRLAVASRESYASMLVHELRNPLLGIRAAAKVLGRGEADPRRAGQLTGISAEAEAALELLDRLTDVQSLESGRLRSALHPVDLGALVRELAQRHAHADHPIRLQDAGLALRVLGDERRLEQVLKNLLANAAKYSPEGAAIEVLVGMTADRASAVVSVRDFGPGVPPGERDRLFQKFARLSTAGGTRGSGLGLYISRGIVRDHGGELSADWPAGGGTVFSMKVPLLR